MKIYYSLYHSKYFSNLLTLQNSSRGVERLSQSIFSAKVDINPHQVEGALFAFKSPLSNGVILADEVGLGKTIEAGLIVTQYWSEYKRKIIIICPASLRKQWEVELKEKFFINSIILDNQTYKRIQKEGHKDPFNLENKVLITSYNFASKMNENILKNRYDLAIIDEAHKLRNVYKPNNIMANNIKNALYGTKKVLLTATPLQNSLLELYGLVSVLDERIFGDKKSFIYQFASGKLTNNQFKDLKNRISSICHRTLRKDVIEYVPYTNRIALIQEFYPSDDEQTLYELVSDFLQNTNLHSIPTSQKTLIILIVRKLLASSTRAIENTLSTMIERLQKSLNSQFQEKIDIDEDEELIEEYTDEDEEIEDIKQLTPEDIHQIQHEILELKSFKELAKSIKLDAKLEKLLSALEKGFQKQSELGSDKKAIIFTESTRTQIYLKEYLELNGFENKVVLFNGTNTDDTSKKIYHQWIEKYKDSDKITGSKTADMKQSIVEYFKDEATIMIATEAGSEGINLQFCNLLINYDLPWNPQRIEQRIGRVHRYGQKYDVVVVNFLNKKNEADQRVYELLSEKFQLFDGVFGSSDEILGIVENGVDFEKAILNLYQSCRTSEEIQTAFDDLQKELEVQINKTMKSTRKKLLENFDTDVHKRLKGHLEDSLKQMDLYEKTFWDLTKIELNDFATFNDSEATFQLKKNINKDISVGKYQLITKDTSNNYYVYRINSKLGEYVLNSSLNRELKTSKIVFDLTGSGYKITALEKYIKKSGYLKVSRLTLNGFEKEEYLLFSSINENMVKINSEIIEQIFNLKCNSVMDIDIKNTVCEKLLEIENINTDKILQSTEKRNAKFFDIEIDKLDRWADDQIISLDRQLKDIREEIKDKRTETKKVDVTHKLKLQMEIRDLEVKQIKIKRQIEESEDEILRKREDIIDNLMLMVKGNISIKELFTIKWEII